MTEYELPDEWFEEHDGQRLVLNVEKVKDGFAHNERAIRACNQKIGELELWAKDYREQIAFWKAKAESAGTADEHGVPRAEE